MYMNKYTYICVHVYIRVRYQQPSKAREPQSVFFAIQLLHKCFYFLCSLLIPYWMGLCVLRSKSWQDYETLFHVVILSKHHHHQWAIRCVCTCVNISTYGVMNMYIHTYLGKNLNGAMKSTPWPFLDLEILLSVTIGVLATKRVLYMKIHVLKSEYIYICIFMNLYINIHINRYGYTYGINKWINKYVNI
jgi:hypothetical protein